MLILCSVCLLQRSSGNVHVMFVDVDADWNSVCAQLKCRIKKCYGCYKITGLHCLGWQYLNICLLSAWLADENLNASNKLALVGPAKERSSSAESLGCGRVQPWGALFQGWGFLSFSFFSIFPMTFVTPHEYLYI